MNGQSQPGGNVETRQVAAVEKPDSNLTEIAQLVNGMMKEYIMPVMRDAGLVKEANEICKLKLQADDPRVIEFALNCREKESKINEAAEQKGCDEKQLAVISNYFSKLITTVKGSSQSFQAEAPREVTA